MLGKCAKRTPKGDVLGTVDLPYTYYAISTTCVQPVSEVAEKPPEAVSEVVNFKIFLGEHAPRPPSLGVLLHAIAHPSVGSALLMA